MYEQVLVPTDGSTGTAHVAMQAYDLAETYDAAVHILHVIDDDIGTILTGDSETRSNLRGQGRSVIKPLEKLAESYDVETTTELREGDPSDEIRAAADDIDADVIVMGTHGRSGMERRVIGSVAERVVRHSERPVMTIRLPDTDRTIADRTAAAEIVREELTSDGFSDVVVEGINEQRNFWIVDVSADGERYNIYVDPVTRRTSSVRRTVA